MTGPWSTFCKHYWHGLPRNIDTLNLELRMLSTTYSEPLNALYHLHLKLYSSSKSLDLKLQTLTKQTITTYWPDLLPAMAVTKKKQQKTRDDTIALIRCAAIMAMGLKRFSPSSRLLVGQNSYTSVLASYFPWITQRSISECAPFSSVRDHLSERFYGSGKMYYQGNEFKFQPKL